MLMFDIQGAGPWSRFFDEAHQAVHREGQIAALRAGIDITEEAIALTPVGTGEARSGWEVMLEPSHGGTRVQNLVRHVQYLERGHSKKARRGMLGPAVAKHGPSHAVYLQEGLQIVADAAPDYRSVSASRKKEFFRQKAIAKRISSGKGRGGSSISSAKRAAGAAARGRGAAARAGGGGRGRGRGVRTVKAAVRKAQRVVRRLG